VVSEVEELKEVVNEAAATATTSQITKDDLPQKLKFAEDAAVLPDVEDEQIKLDDFLAEVEAELISRALRRSKGNRAQAARSLGISRGKLLRRIEQLKVDDRESE
jgi:DNA-binding NtrC family response regulator